TRTRVAAAAPAAAGAGWTTPLRDRRAGDQPRRCLLHDRHDPRLCAALSAGRIALLDWGRPHPATAKMAPDGGAGEAGGIRGDSAARRIAARLAADVSSARVEGVPTRRVVLANPRASEGGLADPR